MIEARPQRPQAGDPLRIVLIDDNPEDRDHLRRMLLAGLTRRVQIVEAATGEQGIIACSRGCAGSTTWCSIFTSPT